MSTQPMEERGSGWLEFTAVLLFAGRVPPDHLGDQLLRRQQEGQRSPRDALQQSHVGLGRASTGDLDSAWNDFESAVKDVPDDASVSDAVSDVTSSADQLKSTAQSTAASVDCSS